jgi:hypothetical protein
MRKLVLQITILITSLIVICGSSCKKEKETVCSNENTVSLPKDLVERFFFKDSSYWVYKDSVLGDLDSIWVKSSSVSINKLELIDENSKGKCAESGTYYFKSSFAEEYNIQIGPLPSKLGTEYKDELFQVNIQRGNYLVLFARMKNSQFHNIGNEYGVIDTIPSLLVNGITYSDVLRKTNKSSMHPDLYYTSYYVRNIGLIKFIRNDKSVWELIRYKIK